MACWHQLTTSIQITRRFFESSIESSKHC
jgi:hypothetical protein